MNSKAEPVCYIMSLLPIKVAIELTVNKGNSVKGFSDEAKVFVNDEKCKNCMKNQGYDVI